MLMSFQQTNSNTDGNLQRFDLPYTHIVCSLCNTKTGAHPILPVPVYEKDSDAKGPDIASDILVNVTNGSFPKVSTTQNSWEVAGKHAVPGAKTTEPTIVFSNEQRTTMNGKEEDSEAIMNPNSIRAYVDGREVKIERSELLSAGKEMSVTIPALSEITSVNITLSGANLEKLKAEGANEGFGITDLGMVVTFGMVVDDTTVQFDVITPKRNAELKVLDSVEVMKYLQLLRTHADGTTPAPDWWHFTPNETTAAPGKASLYFVKNLRGLSEWNAEWEETFKAETREEIAEAKAAQKAKKEVKNAEWRELRNSIDAERGVSRKEKDASIQLAKKKIAAAAKEESDKAYAEAALCKRFRLGQVEKIEFPTIVVEQHVRPYKPIGAEAAHVGDGGGGGGGAAAAGSSKELTRGLPLEHLPVNLVKHLDYRRCGERERKTETCEQVHGGAADTVCTIPAKLKKAVSIVTNADKKDTFLVCAGYPESTKAVAAALGGIAGIGVDEVETVLADDDLPGHGGAGTRAKKFQAFQSNGGKKILCMEFKGNCDGINLFAANHLILLDTPKSWEIEKQLIGRVYRIGQKRDVTVHTIVVEDTIESRQAKQREEWRRSPDVNTDSILDDVETGDSAEAACRMLKWLITGKKGY